MYLGVEIYVRAHEWEVLEMQRYTLKVIGDVVVLLPNVDELGGSYVQIFYVEVVVDVASFVDDLQ